MWLPKDERKTLRKYHSYFSNINEAIHFINISERACNATTNLIERGLIHEVRGEGKEHFKHLSTWIARELVDLANFLSSSKEDEVVQKVILEFTLKGLDLANKYNCWFTRSGLWFAECKDHWLWLILGFIGGILGALLVNWLSN